MTLAGSGHWRCPAGHLVEPEGARYCPTCGLQVACQNGHLIAGADSSFCESCGAPLTPQSSGAPIPAQRVGLAGRIGITVLGVLAALAVVGFIVVLAFDDDSVSGRAATAFAALPGGNTASGAAAAANPAPGAAAAGATTSTGGSATVSAASPTPGSAPPAVTSTTAAPTSPGQAAATPTKAPVSTIPAATATPRPPTSTPPPPTATTLPPTATNTPIPPTVAPRVAVYGYLTIGGSPCGGCEVAFVGAKSVTVVANSGGFYDTLPSGVNLTTGTYKVYYTCKGQLVPADPVSVVLQAKDNNFLNVKIGFCG